MTSLLPGLPRKVCVGSSEIKSLMGTCTHRGSYDVFGSKTTDEEEVFANGEYMEVATILESSFLKLTEIKLQRQGFDIIIKPGKTVYKQVDGVNLRDTADGFAVPSTRHHKPLYTIETKAGYRADRDYYGEEWTDDVHEGYKDQCIWHCGMTGAPACVLSVQFFPTEFPKIYVIKEDPERFALQVNTAVSFWKNHVETGIAPPVDASPACARHLAKLAMKSENLRDASIDERSWAEELAQLKKIEKANKVRIALLQNQLREAAGEYRGIDFGDGAKVTFSPDKNGKRRMSSSLKALEI